MRITGGTLKGRIIRCPRGEIRPAMDRMRESLFSILGNLENKSFLDLFSGSGICALEASSRGANPVYLVEKDKKKVQTIFDNISISETRIECKFVPVESFLNRSKLGFDIIYTDPPFSYKYNLELLKSASLMPVLNNNGVFIIHYPKEIKLPKEILSLKIFDSRKYGRSRLNFYKKTV